MDKDDPTKILGKSFKPLMEPLASYEKWGFYGPVIFLCGVLVHDRTVKIYYGAADTSVCYAEVTIDDIFAELTYY